MGAERDRPDAWDEYLTCCSREELLAQAVEALKECRRTIPPSAVAELDPALAEISLILTDRARPVHGSGVALGPPALRKILDVVLRTLPVLAQVLPPDSDMSRAGDVLCTRLMMWREELGGP